MERSGMWVWLKIWVRMGLCCHRKGAVEGNQKLGRKWKWTSYEEMERTKMFIPPKQFCWGPALRKMIWANHLYHFGQVFIIGLDYYLFLFINPESIPAASLNQKNKNKGLRAWCCCREWLYLGRVHVRFESVLDTHKREDREQVC